MACWNAIGKMLRPTFVNARSAATVTQTIESVLVSSIVKRRSVPFTMQMGRSMSPVTMQESADIATGAPMCSKMCLVRIVFDTAIATNNRKDSRVDVFKVNFVDAC